MIARRRKRSKRWISWLMFLMLVVVAGVVCYLVWDNYFNDKKGNDGGLESEVIDNEKVKEIESENIGNTNETEVVKKEEVVQYDGEDPNTGNDLTGVITYAGVNGGKLMIRVNINQYLSGGSCVLRLVSQDGSLAFSDTANIVNSASTSTCEGFDVSTGELGEGTYNIYIDLNADGKAGTISGGVSI